VEKKVKTTPDGRNPSDLMDAVEVAEYLKLTAKQLAYKVRTRQIPYLKLGTTLRFRRSELDAWIREFPAMPGESRRGKWDRSKRRARKRAS